MGGAAQVGVVDEPGAEALGAVAVGSVPDRRRVSRMKLEIYFMDTDNSL